MKPKTCANCGGALVKQEIDYEKKVGNRRALFENVPAQVCTRCEEVWLDASVAEKIEKLFWKSLRPKKWLRIPILSLSKLSS